MNDHLLTLAWTQLWQVTLLVVVGAALVRVIARNRPHLAYGLWLVVLVKCVTPPLLVSASGIFCWMQPIERTAMAESHLSPEATIPITSLHEPIAALYPVESIPADMQTRSTTQEPMAFRVSPLHLPIFTFILWAFGAAVSLALSAWHWHKCLRAARRDPGEGARDLEPRARALAEKLGLRRRVRVIITKDRLGPAVTGIRRPTLFMPEEMLAGTGSAELEAILGHELIHIRRGDLWAGLLQTVVLALWWFHPLVRWAVRQAMAEAERCCDEAVLAELGCRPKDYARSLLNVLQYQTDWVPAPAFPGAGRIDATAKRLERIMALRQGCRSRSPWWCWLVVLAAAVVVLPGGAFVVSAENAPVPLSGSDDSQEHENADVPQVVAAVSSPSNGIRTTGTDSRFCVTYEAGDVLAEIRRVIGNKEEAKAELLSLCGFDANGKSCRGTGSMVRWIDDVLSVNATSLEHETIFAELEAIREHGLCPLEIETLCVEGPVEEILSLLESEPLAEDLFREQKERESRRSVHLSVRSLVLKTDVEQLMQHSKANPAVRVLAWPRLKVRPGMTAAVRIGREVRLGPDIPGELAAVRHVPVGLEMRFEAHLRSENRVLLHSDISFSEVDSDASEVDDNGSLRAKGIHVTSQQASSITLGPLGDTIAIRTRGVKHSERDSEQALFLVRVRKLKIASADSTVGQQMRPDEDDPRDSLIRRSALEEDCKRRQVTVSDAEIDAEIARRATRMHEVHADGSPDVQKWLALITDQLGVTVKAYRRDVIWPAVAMRKLAERAGQNTPGEQVPSGRQSSAENVTLKTPGLYLVSYNVAGLVVPRIETRFIPPASGGRNPVNASVFQSLIELITATIAPETWEDNGGEGTVAPFEERLSLIIRQSKEVHEQIVDTLTGLRRLQGLRIDMRTRTVEVSDRFCQENWPEIAGKAHHCVMAPDRFDDLLSRLSEDSKEANADRSVTRGPCVALFNGQLADLALTALVGQAGSGHRLRLHPNVSQDNRSMYLNAITVPEAAPGVHREATLQVGMNSSDTLALEITECVEQHDASQRTFVLVTPTVVQ